jgi:hypothetical protein
VVSWLDIDAPGLNSYQARFEVEAKRGLTLREVLVVPAMGGQDDRGFRRRPLRRRGPEGPGGRGDY